MRIKAFFHLTLALLTCLISRAALGYETDQYSSSFVEMRDSTEKIDEIVNAGIDEIIANWARGRDEEALMKKIFKKFSSREFERWLNDSSEIDSRNAKGESIYRTTPYFVSPIIRWKGLASTVVVNGVYLGTDKLSHFFGVGRGYFEEFQSSKASSVEEKEKAAIAWGLFTEHAYWGRATTRVFSNADLVANYEGLLFYRGLLEDNIVNGQKALIRWENDRPVRQRKFSFRDHVNDYWNEALNPNRFYSPLRSRVLGVLETFCDRPDFESKKDRLKSKNVEQLEARYAKLGFVRDSEDLTLVALCQRFHSLSPAEQKAKLTKQTELDQSYHEIMKNEPIRYSDVRKDIEDLIPPVPFCGGQIRNAAKEHDIMMKWFDGNTRVVAEQLRQGLRQNPGLLMSIQASKFKDTKLIQELIQKLGWTTTVDPSVVMTNARTGVSNLLVRSQNGEWIQSELSINQLEENEMQICLKQLIPNLKENGAREGTRIQLNSCVEVDASGQADSEVSFSYWLRNNYRTRVSQSGYYDLDDKVGFIYRSISDLCKWY